jgi:hypothetical protein
MPDLGTVIDRLRSALVEALPKSCKVTERPLTLFLSDDAAVTAKILVRNEDGRPRLAVIASIARSFAEVLLENDLVEEVWAVDADVGQVEQFLKGSNEPKVVDANEELRSVAVPGLVIALETVLG